MDEKNHNTQWGGGEVSLEELHTSKVKVKNKKFRFGGQLISLKMKIKGVQKKGNLVKFHYFTKSKH